VKLTRILLTPKKDADGRFIQPKEVGPDRELVEQHNRMRAAAKAEYADPLTGNTATFDPKGNYNCGSCNQQDKGDCELVQVDPVDVDAGSCGKYEIECAGDPEIKDLKRLTVTSAGYAIASNGEGFGCHRCPYGIKAYAADSQGRDLYCNEWECRVFWNTCCNSNAAEEIPIDKDGQPKSGKRSATSQRGSGSNYDSDMKKMVRKSLS
jgi:hypothetical protein